MWSSDGTETRSAFRHEGGEGGGGGGYLLVAVKLLFVGINAYRIYPVAMRCLHVDTRVRAARSLARSHYIVILCTSGSMNMDSLPLHLAGSSSIYAGASSR